MNFFARQDQARRQTRLLVFLFVLTVAILIAAFYVAVSIGFLFSPFDLGRPHRGVLTAHALEAGWTSAAMLAVIVGGSLWRMRELRAGGTVVADMVGARLLPPDARNTRERRLLNVVEEMALAAGLAVPRVGVLDAEPGINAFAAGFSANDAVVVVSEGALARLTRDELQGVVAHEFAHLQNGDTRLNLRMIGLLHGLLLINLMGRMLTETTVSADGKKEASAFFVAGLVLRVLGYLGVVAARLIKAAISRQREFLADASAVQFTRHVDGLGGALRKIGGLALRGGPGSNIGRIQAEALSHLFVAGISPALRTGWFATHPPLEERLAQLYGRDFVAWRDAPVLEEDEDAGDDGGAIPTGIAGDAGVVAWVSPHADTPAPAPQAAAPSPGAPGADRGSVPSPAMAPRGPAPLPPELVQAARDPEGAPALVLALLQVPASGTIATLEALLQTLPPGARLPLIDLATPTLRALPGAARVALLAQVGAAIRADGRVTLFEFVVETLLTQRLRPGHARATPIRSFDEPTLRAHLGALLQLVAHVAGAAASVRQENGGTATDTQATGSPADGMQRAWEAGAAALLRDGLIARPLEAGLSARPDLARVQAALAALAMLAPLKKPLVLRALHEATRANGLAAPEAREILRALGAALDVPMPAENPGIG